MEKIIKKYNITDIKRIDEGWSNTYKYILFSHDKKYILKEISQDDRYHTKEKIQLIKKITISNSNTNTFIEDGYLSNGSFYYLLSYIDGTSLYKNLKSHTNDESYKIGLATGKILNSIHSIEIDGIQNSPSFNHHDKVKTCIELINNLNFKNKKKDRLLKYYIDNYHLLHNRPLSVVHGDFQLSNIIINNGNIFFIDLERCHYGDPYSDFKNHYWNILLNEFFSVGLIDGYFNNNIPEDFFPLLKLYLIEGVLSFIPFAMKNGKKEMLKLEFSLKCLMNWYNNLKDTIPTWYLKIHKKLKI